MQAGRQPLALVSLLLLSVLVAVPLHGATDAGTVEAAIDITVPQATRLASGAAAIITGLLLLLYLYRRRPYILLWTAGWGALALSLALGGRDAAITKSGALAFGASQFVGLISAILFVAAADAYQAKPRLRLRHSMLLVPLAIWFLLSPLALGPAAVRTPGYLLSGMTLAAAGAFHLVILRQARFLGAGVVGTMLLITSLTDVRMALVPGGGAPQGPSEAFLAGLALYLVTALGMQLMTFEDMTFELRRANTRLETARSELRQMVVTDALTGCRNRRFFDEIIAHELNLHRRYGTPLSLLFVDIDRFKAINDTLGHAAGDRTLREVAAFLVKKTRDADYVFRWGGDEFLLLLSCREEEAQRRGAELQLEFSRSPGIAALPHGVGLSFGCAEVSPLAETALDALKAADERMYSNKRAPRLTEIRAV